MLRPHIAFIGSKEEMHTRISGVLNCFPRRFYVGGQRHRQSSDDRREGVRIIRNQLIADDSPRRYRIFSLSHCSGDFGDFFTVASRNREACLDSAYALPGYCRRDFGFATWLELVFVRQRLSAITQGGIKLNDGQAVRPGYEIFYAHRLKPAEMRNSRLSGAV
jgi:hypothetical protein